MHPDIARVLHHETTILSRLDEMAREIMRDYRGRPLTVVCILHGGLIFMADLLRRVHLPLQLQTIAASSYAGTSSTGTVTIHQPLPDLRGRHVILLDDILDSGRTLHTIREMLLLESGAESVALCVLLRKRRPRDFHVEAEYAGFEIGDEFVVGYGLDCNGHYRNLPFIGVLKPEIAASATSDS